MTANEARWFLPNGDVARDGELPIAPDVIGEVLRPGHDVLIDDA